MDPQGSQTPRPCFDFACFLFLELLLLLEPLTAEKVRWKNVSGVCQCPPPHRRPSPTPSPTSPTSSSRLAHDATFPLLPAKPACCGSRRLIRWLLFTLESRNSRLGPEPSPMGRKSLRVIALGRDRRDDLCMRVFFFFLFKLPCYFSGRVFLSSLPPCLTATISSCQPRHRPGTRPRGLGPRSGCRRRVTLSVGHLPDVNCWSGWAIKATPAFGERPVGERLPARGSKHGPPRRSATRSITTGRPRSRLLGPQNDAHTKQGWCVDSRACESFH